MSLLKSDKLGYVCSVNDLEIILDSKQTFLPHLDDIASKSAEMHYVCLCAFRPEFGRFIIICVIFAILNAYRTDVCKLIFWYHLFISYKIFKTITYIHGRRRGRSWSHIINVCSFRSYFYYSSVISDSCRSK